ncbi:MAG: hypothetical protein K2M89_06935 [Clostridiales bacterium]|nr:hypothetical protein [Clostridiales bacterium]
MKKKLLVLVTALVLVLTCALGLIACGDGFEEGTYTMYMETGDKEVVSMGDYELKDGNITLLGQKVGTYKVDGDDLTVTVQGESAKYVKSGKMWKYTEDGHTALIVKKGEKPEGYTVKTAADYN